ncbi:MAG: hypothetical protein BWY69_00484 [Planctomycetes bacterium ADurb.Bin401]|nr:MAG: hypothetical protein BWY69_00484 [Planctomycetes bacterium ADurb.Bin401]
METFETGYFAGFIIEKRSTPHIVNSALTVNICAFNCFSLEQFSKFAFIARRICLAEIMIALASFGHSEHLLYRRIGIFNIIILVDYADPVGNCVENIFEPLALLGKSRFLLPETPEKSAVRVDKLLLDQGPVNKIKRNYSKQMPDEIGASVNIEIKRKCHLGHNRDYQA